MGFQIVWTASALQELKEICEYIAEDDPGAASRVGNELVNHVGILESFPQIGPVYPPCGDPNVREILCLNFRIFYQISQERKLIEILHLWHGARDEPKGKDLRI